MPRERKELGVGATQKAAIKSFAEFDAEVHEAVLDAVTGLWQVFRKRVARDRTVRKPIKREGTAPYANYGPDRRPIVVILHPGELIETRLKGRRKGFFITWHDLHHYNVLNAARQALNEKRAAKKARKQAASARRKERSRARRGK